MSNLAELSTRLRSALVADALDGQELRFQCLGPGIKPLSAGPVIVGPAFTVQIAAVEAVPDVPYVGLLEAVDAIQAGDIFVAATGGLLGVAVWGELITTACLHRGAVGSVCDGYARDSRLLRQLTFPVFCRGTVPYDSNGRSEVLRHSVPVTIDGITIHPNDLVVADDDGVVIVPAASAEAIVEAALSKDAHESEFRSAVASGMSATQAFKTFGVL